MKNITVSCVLVIVFLAGPLEGGELIKNYDFSTTPFFGFMYGTAGKTLYEHPGGGKELNRLDWKMDPLFYFGGRVELSRPRPLELWGLFLAFDMKFGLRGKTGFLENREWQAANHGGLTAFSTHDNNVQNMTDLDMRAGVSFPLLDMFALKIYGEFFYTRFSFYAADGEGEYAQQLGAGIYEESFSGSESFTGTVITSVQNWFAVSPGVSLFFPFHRLFQGEVSFAVSPVVFCNTRDLYLKRNPAFERRDYMKWGLFLEPGITFSFTPGEKLFVSLGFSWRYIRGTKGENHAGEDPSGASGTEASLSRIGVIIGAGWRF
ncbi:MAG: omptin family outer membrane protease [Treponema sp.]|jgi:outer membrane protease|nr:omptin family outer membrane protease [Treponema sp.]